MRTATKQLMDGIARRKRHWLADNPGILSQMERDLGVSHSYISRILHGKFTPEARRAPVYEEVTEALRKAGAPGF
jgi:transcriptional regulator with XRE-family HTH domain